MTPERPQLITQAMLEMVPVSSDIEWYMLLCTQCGNGDLWMPFEDAASRGHWAAEHTRLTTLPKQVPHTKYRVVDIPHEAKKDG